MSREFGDAKQQRCAKQKTDDYSVRSSSSAINVLVGGDIVAKGLEQMRRARRSNRMAVDISAISLARSFFVCFNED